VAEILNRVDQAMSEEILTEIHDQQETVEQGIRHYMFVFDDLMLIDSKGIKEVVAKIDRKLLVLGLKGTSDQLKDHLLSCMSQRGAAMVREDMEALGPVKIKDVETAQQQIIAIVRMLQADGLISLSGDGKDQYVA
jgi:flagellar motor switch protein FliG